MSRFVKLITGAVRSDTMKFNGILAAVWAALYQSDLIQTNPEYVAIFGGISALVGLFLRAKTSKPLTER